jgi:hypothetical protein
MDQVRIFSSWPGKVLPASSRQEGDHLEFGSRSEWVRFNCRQDAGSTLPEHHDETMSRWIWGASGLPPERRTPVRRDPLSGTNAPIWKSALRLCPPSQAQCPDAPMDLFRDFPALPCPFAFA